MYECSLDRRVGAFKLVKLVERWTKKQGSRERERRVC